MQCLELARERGEVTRVQEELEHVLLVHEDLNLALSLDQGMAVSFLLGDVFMRDFGLEGL